MKYSMTLCIVLLSFITTVQTLRAKTGGNYDVKLAQNNPLGDELNRMSNQAQGLEQQSRSTPITADAGNGGGSSGIDRFRNSPCFQTLGFEPSMSYEDQDDKYRNCEEAKRKKNKDKNLPLTIGIIFVLGGFVTLIVLDNRKVSRKQQS